MDPKRQEATSGEAKTRWQKNLVAGRARPF